MPTTPYVDLDNIHTPSVGATPPASWGVAVRENMETLARSPGCVVVRTASQTFGASAQNPVEFTAADLRDTDGYHDPSSNPEQIVIPTGLGGWYDIGWRAVWAFSSSGRRSAAVTVNGVSAGAITYAPDPAATMGLGGSRFLSLAAGDVVTLVLQQTTAGNLNMNSAEFWLTLRAWP